MRCPACRLFQRSFPVPKAKSTSAKTGAASAKASSAEDSFEESPSSEKDAFEAKNRVIKKYPNRRLYDTETSTYITLTDVRQLVLDQEEFKVMDAKSSEDLTRSILL